MGTDDLINRLSLLFNPDECRDIVRAFNQDSLAWKAISDPLTFSNYYDYAQADIAKWSPGYLAAFLIDKDNLNGIDWQNHEQLLPDSVRTQAHQAYETLRSTRLIPETLEQAGLLALHVREYYVEQANWQGVNKRLLIRFSNPVSNFYYNLWRSTFSCLPALLPQFDQFATSLIFETESTTQQDFATLVIHALLSMPLTHSQILDRIKSIFSELDLVSQSISLSSLAQYGFNTLAGKLAGEYLTDQKNLERFTEALTFSGEDETRNAKYYQHVQTLELLSDFYLYAGEKDKSVEIMQNAANLLNKSQSRLYHRLAQSSQVEDPISAKSYWLKAISTEQMPDHMKIEYAEFLASQNSLEEAQEFLSQNSDPVSKTILNLHNHQPDLDTFYTNEQQPSLIDYFEFSEKSDFPPESVKRQLGQAIPSITQANDLRKVLDLVEKQLKKSPNDREFLKQAICLHNKMGQLNSAINKAALIATLDPEDKQNKKMLAELYTQSRQFDKAFEIKEALLKNSPSPTREELLDYASTAVEAGKSDLAIPICKNFLEKDKLDGDALVILGNAYIAQGEKSMAIEHMEKAASIAPEKPSSWLALANIWSRMGQNDREMDTLLKAKTAIPDNPSILLSLGNSLLKNQLPSDALPVLFQCKRLDPRNKKVKIALAKAHHLLGHNQEAWQAIEDIQNQTFLDPDLALISGKVLGEMGSHKQAVSALKYAFDTNKSEEALVSLAKELLITAKLPAVDVETSDNGKNDLQSILLKLDEYLDNDGDNFLIQLIQADIRSALGDYEKAYKAYLDLSEKPEAKSPQTYQHIQFGIGKNAYNLEYPEISLAALQEAIINNPDNIEAHHYLAEAFVKSGLVDEGFKSAKTALNMLPVDMDNLLWFSDFMMRNGQPQSAVQSLKDAVQIAPQQRALYLTLAKTHIALNDYEAAKSTLGDLVDMDEISTEEMLNAANILYRLEDVDKATSILSKAAKNNDKPDFNTLRELAGSIQRIGKPEEALALLDAHAESFTNDPAYAVLRSDVLAQLARYADADAAIEPVLRKIEYLPELFGKTTSSREGGQQTFVNYSPAGVYWRAAQLERIKGDYLPAKKHLNQALIYASGEADVEYLSAELAFSLGNKASLKDTLKKLRSDEDRTNPGRNSQSLSALCKLCLLSLLEGDLETANKIVKDQLDNYEPSSESFAIQAYLAASYGEVQIAEDYFTRAETKINESTLKQQSKMLTIPEKFDSSWQKFSLAVAAWKLSKWDKAYELFEDALSDVNIIPIVNLTFANFLLAYHNERCLCEVMQIIAHSPQKEINQTELQKQFSEQLSLAGRFLDGKYIDHLIKKGQVIFNTTRTLDEDFSKMIKNQEDAVLLLQNIQDTKTIKTILDAYPENDSVQMAYAVKIWKSNPEKSALIASQLLEKNPSSPVLKALFAFSNNENPQKAINAIEKALSTWPDEPQWHAIAAELHFRQEQYGPAGEHLEKAISINPLQASYWQLLGEVKLQEKDLVSAKSYMAKACDIFPDNIKALQALSSINYRMGDFSAALNCLEMAESKDPKELGHSESIAELYFKHGDFEKAAEAANKVLNSHPDSLRALLVLVKTYIQENNLELAKAALLPAIVKDPKSWQLKLIEIDLMNAEKGAPTALTAAIDLAAENQENPEVINKLASLLLETDRQDQAEKALYHSLEINPDQAEVYLVLGRINRKNGNLDQAIDQLSKAVVSDPSLVEAYLELGKTYQDRREHTNAINSYKQAIEIVDNDPRLYFQAGIAYKESRDYRNAEAMFRKAASLAPSDIAVRRQLAAVVTLNLVHNLQEAPRK